MLRGYAGKPSLYAGETLKLHVSTKFHFVPLPFQFRIDFYRQGRDLYFIQSTDWQIGWSCPPRKWYEDWHWLGYDFPIPSDWKSGVYVAVLILGDGIGKVLHSPDVDSADGEDSKILFVVKNPNPIPSTKILYDIPFITFQAYNNTGNGSLYNSGPVDGNTIVAPEDIEQRSRKVSMLRPGAGVGGDRTNPNTRDPVTHWPAEGFIANDPYLIGWLEENNYEVDFCADVDLHENPDILKPYNLLVLGSHHEYWSEEMRTNVENFRNNGGNIAIFSACTCWWRVHFSNNNTAFYCDRGDYVPGVLPLTPATFPDTEFSKDKWWAINKPEDALVGASFLNGAGYWKDDGTMDDRPPLGYTVQHADHWVYEGTNLNDGDTFGQEDFLIGNEADGVMFDYSLKPLGEPSNSNIIVPIESKTPSNFVILGFALFDNRWHRPNWDLGRATEAAATMGIYCKGGIVFNAATIDWSRVLDFDQNSIVDRITRNVIDRLQSRGICIEGPFFKERERLGSLSNITMAGECISVHVKLPLMLEKKVHYKWTCSAGKGKSLNAPTFQIKLPSKEQPVTITVKITAEDMSPTFGTMTVIPISKKKFYTMELMSHMHNLVMQLRPKAFPEAGTRETNSVNKFWDPVHAGNSRNFNSQDLKETILNAQKVINIARKMTKITKQKSNKKHTSKQTRGFS